MPSVSSEAKASASAWPNSIGPSSSDLDRGGSSGLRSLRWIVKLSGTLSSSSLRVRSRFSETVVSTSGLFDAVELAGAGPVELGSSYSPRSIFARRSLSRLESSSRRSFASLLDVLGA